MKIGFGSDHAAIELKACLLEHLKEKGYECVDYGAYSPDQKVDYPIAGRKVAEAIRRGEIDKGVLVCGTGVGISLAANKVPGIRAGVCSDCFTAKMVKEHNHCQIIAMGQRVVAFDSQFGQIGLNHDIFFKKLPAKTSASAATSQKAPATPVWDNSTPAAVNSSQSDSKFATADAGNVFYAVSAINRFGESQLAVIGSAVAITAGCTVDLKFAAGVGTNAPTAYRIYRSKVGAAATDAMYPLFDVSVKDLTDGYDGASAGIIRDKNHFLPDCDQAMLVQFDNEVVEFAQLAPLMKMDLAVLSPAFRFMILLYGTPFLYAPKKMVRFVNIGSKLITA